MNSSICLERLNFNIYMSESEFQPNFCFLLLFFKEFTNTAEMTLESNTLKFSSWN